MGGTCNTYGAIRGADNSVVGIPKKKKDNWVDRGTDGRIVLKLSCKNQSLVVNQMDRAGPCGHSTDISCFHNTRGYSRQQRDC
jgi:hypothetical protein